MGTVGYKFSTSTSSFVRARKRGTKMTESQLRSMLSAMRANAVLYNNEGDLAAERTASLRAYHGRPYGNERKGRSQVVTRDVMETVETVMPELVETFVGGDDVVEFEATQEEEEKQAEQATQYCNHVF